MDGGREGERETEITSISVSADRDNEIESSERDRETGFEGLNEVVRLGGAFLQLARQRYIPFL